MLQPKTLYKRSEARYKEYPYSSTPNHVYTLSVYRALSPTRPPYAELVWTIAKQIVMDFLHQHMEDSMRFS
jgi:hypothetical protein